MESYSNLFLTLQRDLSAICVARALDAREKGEWTRCSSVGLALAERGAAAALADRVPARFLALRPTPHLQETSWNGRWARSRHSAPHSKNFFTSGVHS